MSEEQVRRPETQRKASAAQLVEDDTQRPSAPVIVDARALDVCPECDADGWCRYRPTPTGGTRG